MTETLTAGNPQADLLAEMRALAGEPPAPAADAVVKRPRGRPRKTPPLEELRGDGDGQGDIVAPETGGGDLPPSPPPADRAPDEGKRTYRKRQPKVSRETAPPYKAGLITGAVNRIYRQAGKIVRAMDSDIGTAIIESARNTAEPGEPDDSVGAAWDELARTNPRVRAFLMKAITGTALMQLVIAHAPIGMAIVMKPAVMKHIPFQKLVTSMAEPDEDSKPGEGGLPGGMTAADVQQMQELAAQQMRRMGMQVSPETMAAMAGMVNGSPPLLPSDPPGVSRETPPAFVRHQPRRPPSRAKR
jgi:hypothetical protein